MTEERVIATLKECVNHLAKKHDLGRARRHNSSKYILRYMTPNKNSKKGTISLEKREKDSTLRFSVILYYYARTICIEVCPEEKEISAVVINDFEDFDYVYGKIMEAMK